MIKIYQAHQCPRRCHTMPPGGRAHVAQRSAAARCRGTRSTKVHDLYHYIIRILLHWFVYHAVHSIRKQFKGEILADACARSVRCTRPEFAWEVAQSCRRHRRPIAVAPALQLVCGGGLRPAAAAAAACMGRHLLGLPPDLLWRVHPFKVEPCSMLRRPIGRLRWCPRRAGCHYRRFGVYFRRHASILPQQHRR